jgi:hypothetical protein
MVVLPLISTTEFTNVADHNEVTLDSDINYNRLSFKNHSGNIGIAIQGFTVIDNEQKAQDRTIPYAHLIKAANAKVIPANCIQQNQSGKFIVSRLDESNFMILPPTLRGIALKKSTHQDAETGALWSSLETWVHGVDCRRLGLTAFYSKFKDTLDRFVAQFEPVENQLGAITLINGVIIAIDIVPKYDTWKRVWRALIRDSYGAEAVRMAENSGQIIAQENLNTQGVDSLDTLEAAYNEMKGSFYDSLYSLVSGTIQYSVGLRRLDTLSELTMLKVESEQFVGQTVLHGDHTVYLSLVPSNAQVKVPEKFKSLRTNPYDSVGFKLFG